MVSVAGGTVLSRLSRRGFVSVLALNTGATSTSRYRFWAPVFVLGKPRSCTVHELRAWLGSNRSEHASALLVLRDASSSVAIRCGRAARDSASER